MSLIKAPLLGELSDHLVDLYCKACKKVTQHVMHFAKYDPDDGRILASCWCQKVRTWKDVKDTSWNVTEYTWVCSTEQTLSLTKEQWDCLVTNKPFKGEGHLRKL